MMIAKMRAEGNKVFLKDNTGFTLPDDIDHLGKAEGTVITELDLSKCSIVGKLKMCLTTFARFCFMTNVCVFLVIKAPLPLTLERLATVDVLRLNGNKLTGLCNRIVFCEADQCFVLVDHLFCR